MKCTHSPNQVDGRKSLRRPQSLASVFFFGETRLENGRQDPVECVSGERGGGGRDIGDREGIVDIFVRSLGNAASRRRHNGASIQT